MGREIRRVPPNWEHPRGERRGDIDYLPKREEEYHAAARKWIADCIAWNNGTHPSQPCESYIYFWEYDGGPPDEEYCLPYDPTDKDLCTWWQCYETVSEGCPVSPPFATAEELIDYLATKGDFWEQNRARREGRPLRPASREAVTKFVLGTGHAPSMVVTHRPDGTRQVAEGIEGLALLDRK